MALTFILILAYWLILSFFSFLGEGGSFFQAIFPVATQQLIIRFSGAFFIGLGNYLLLKKNRSIPNKAAYYASLPKEENKITSKKNDFDFSLPEQAKKDFKNEYLNYKVTSSILRLSFAHISLESFIKLALSLIISDKHFLNCLGAMVFCLGEQSNLLHLKGYHNISASLSDDCRAIGLKDCICGKAAGEKNIQFASDSGECPVSFTQRFSAKHKHYCLPLFHQGSLIGAVDFILDPQCQRSKEVDEYLMQLSNLIAMGIKNKQETKQITEINKCLAGLSEDPAEGIHNLVDLYGKIFVASFACYKRVDQEGGRLISAFQYNPSGYSDSWESKDLIGDEIVSGNKDFIVIKGLAGSKYADNNASIKHNDFSVCVGVKVEQAGRLVGVIYAFYKRDFSPGKREEDKLKAIASAISIEEGRIYENKVFQEACLKLKKTQSSLIQSKKLADVGQFSSGIVHEVRNPIGVILGGIEFLEKKIGTTDKEIGFALKRIKESTLRANSIVDNLLTFAKPSGKRDEILDLKGLVEETVSLLHYKTSLENIKVINQVRKSPFGIRANRNQIQQILFNLFLNAVEAMPQGGKLKIRVLESKVLKKQNKCVVQIVDTGEGIKKEDLSKMFEPFFTTKGQAKGTGLGLAMCKMLAEDNKAQLLISSQWGKGTTAKLIFPVISG